MCVQTRLQLKRLFLFMHSQELLQMESSLSSPYSTSSFTITKFIHFHVSIPQVLLRLTRPPTYIHARDLLNFEEPIYLGVQKALLQLENYMHLYVYTSALHMRSTFISMHAEVLFAH